MRPKIIADHKIPFLQGALEDKADIIYLPGADIDAHAVMDADALIIRTRTHCNEALLKNSSVKFIATATIGYDHIDTSWCEQHGIAWTNAPGCNSSSVEQYMVSALLETFTSFHSDPHNLTIGIIGVGNVGSKVAKVSETLGLKVLMNDPPRQRAEKNGGFCSIEEIIEQADIITFHVPLTKEGIDKTFHLANESFFNKLGKSIILINTSRGPVISQQALKKALTLKQVKACILDVWEGEPSIDSEMSGLAFIGTPHIAGYSTDGKVNGTVMSVRAISKHFNLGMDEWYPAKIPLPDEPNLACDCTRKTELEILRELHLQTYDIKQDYYNLRQNITKFESLRGNYPLRREPSAFSVRLINNSISGLGKKLELLGFTVEYRDFCF